MTWSDLDFDESMIRVRAEVTKTMKGRSIPMSARVKRLLEKRQESEQPKMSDPVFSTIQGRPFYTQALAVFHQFRKGTALLFALAAQGVVLPLQVADL